MKKLMPLLLAVIMSFCLTASAVTISTEYASADLYDPLPEEDEVAVSAGTDVNVDLGLECASAVLMEPYSGTVLYEQNANEITAPASITKIMALILIMEAIDDGRLTLESQITASEYAAGMGGSQIWLKEGESMSLDHLLKAIVIASANDATVAVGEAIAGSETAFVDQMNKKAKELGMDNTTFLNCTGLDADGHMTTAYDVALMSAELIKHPLIMNYSTVWMDSIRDGQSSLVNTNKLVRFYKGCVGLKTGTTSKAGCCVSAAAARDDMTLIAVVMKGNDSNARFQSARKMLDYGFANFEYKSVDSQLPADSTAKIKNGRSNTVRITAEDTLPLLTKKGEAEIKRIAEIYENLKAPIKKGDKVGAVHIYSFDEEVGEIDIIAAESVKKNTVWISFYRLLCGLFGKIRTD